MGAQARAGQAIRERIMRERIMHPATGHNHRSRLPAGLGILAMLLVIGGCSVSPTAAAGSDTAVISDATAPAAAATPPGRRTALQRACLSAADIDVMGDGKHDPSLSAQRQAFYRNCLSAGWEFMPDNSLS